MMRSDAAKCIPVNDYSKYVYSARCTRISSQRHSRGRCVCITFVSQRLFPVSRMVQLSYLFCMVSSLGLDPRTNASKVFSTSVNTFPLWHGTIGFSNCCACKLLFKMLLFKYMRFRAILGKRAKIRLNIRRG